MKRFGYAIVSIFLAVVVLLTSGGISIVRCCQTHCFCLQNSGTQEVDLLSDRYSSESRNDCCKTGGIADKHATKGHSPFCKHVKVEKLNLPIVDIPTGTDWGIQGTIDLTYSFWSVIFCHFCCKVYNYFLYAATAGLSKTNRYTFDLKSDICNWRAGNVPFREIFVLCDIGLFYYIIGLKR